MASSPAAGFDYPALLRGSLIGLVRSLIERVAEDGFPGDHHFLLTFSTREPGVEMSARLRKRFPEEITIVLQHQFWNLKASDEGFTVTLRFGGQPESLTVPWPALRGFADPSCDFGLRFQAASPADSEGESGREDPDDDGVRGPVEAPIAAVEKVREPPPKDGGNVLAFNARKRREGEKA